MTGTMCGAVVIGGYITGLSTVRALASSGMPIAVVVTDSSDIAQYSRWATEHHDLVDFFNKPDSLLDLLEQHARRWQGWVLLPISDEALTVLSQHRERLERSYRIAAPPWEVARNVLQKDLTYRAAQDVGVDVPRIYGDAEPLVAAQSGMTFPVVVKPVESRPFVKCFGVKLFVAHNRAELARAIQKVHARGLRAQVMDLVPGPDSQFHNYSVYIDRHGQPVAELPMKKLRKSPPFFGVVRVAETTTNMALREPTLALLRRIGWRGMASAEYKLDPRDGRYRLMEINGRSFLLQGLACRAGVNYSQLAWQEAAGASVSGSPNGWSGMWIHVLDDLYYGTFFRRLERLSVGQYLSPYCRPKTYAVWSARDPRPFMRHCRQAFEKARAVAVDSEARSLVRRRVVSMPVEPDTIE